MNRFNRYNSELDAFELYHLNYEDIAPYPPQSRRQPSEEYNAIIAGLSGAIGTSIANIAVYPIDLIVKRLQVQRAFQASQDDPKKNKDNLYTGFSDAARRIYDEEGGVKAFYSGCLQDTANSMGSAFIYFVSYNFMRERRLKANTLPSGKVPKTLGVAEELAVGVVAGAIAKFFTAPIANVVTRKQTAALRSKQDKSDSKTNASDDMASIVQEIYKEKGVQGFWSGYDATLILTLNPAITFFLYESFKSLLPRRYREQPTGGQTFLLAAVSKAVASSIMYPISMAKARSQVQKKRQGGGRFAIFESLLQTYKTEGFAGMYEGVFGEVLKGFFSNGLTMLVKEMLHRQILSIYFFLLKLRSRNMTLKDVARDAAEDVYRNSTTLNQRIAISDMATKSQEKLGSAKAKIGSLEEQVSEKFAAVKDSIYTAVESGATKAADTTTDARKGLARMIDPETPHVGDVSGEVGGIEWDDAVPAPSLPTGDVESKIGGFEWKDGGKY